MAHFLTSLKVTGLFYRYKHGKMNIRKNGRKKPPMRLLLAEDEKATCQKQQSSRPITDRTLRNWRPCQRTRQWCRRLPDQAFFHERTFSTYSCTHKASGTDSFDTRTWLFNHCINGKRSHLFHWLPPVAKRWHWTSNRNLSIMEMKGWSASWSLFFWIMPSNIQMKDGKSITFFVRL